METKTLDQIKDKYYGTVGTPKRDKLESEMAALRIGVKLRAARESLNMTQQELAIKLDKKRSFISKVENDSENITLKTLFDIVERGLGGKLRVEVQF
jgi:DNA-binding XRE family transcriptional regulator